MSAAQAIGLVPVEVFDPASPERVEALGVLLQEFERFFRAGGVITLGDWSGFTALERAVAEEAGGAVTSERAALFGLAAMGKVPEVLSGADGGATLAQAEAEGLAREVAAASRKDAKR